MKDLAITINGMSCGHCLNAVTKALSSVPGLEVRSVRIGRAEVTVEDAAVNEQAKAAIERAGYKVEAIVPA